MEPHRASTKRDKLTFPSLFSPSSFSTLDSPSSLVISGLFPRPSSFFPFALLFAVGSRPPSAPQCPSSHCLFRLQLGRRRFLRLPDLDLAAVVLEGAKRSLSSLSLSYSLNRCLFCVFSFVLFLLLLPVSCFLPSFSRRRRGRQQEPWPRSRLYPLLLPRGLVRCLRCPPSASASASTAVLFLPAAVPGASTATAAGSRRSFFS
jgi:hypothetical protein